jgi:exopolyphosphatase/guanosine-5'-triphosphate,3'-diphosphate pyrophosphatase
MHREKIGVAFGMGSMQTKRIQDDAINRAIAALNDFQKKADQLGCSQVLAFSTAVLRNAENSEEVLNQIEEATGLHVQVISGEQEAEWIALAAMYGTENNKKALVLDIGGGSVELILVENQEILKLGSFPLGVTRLLEMKTWSDPLSYEDVLELKAHCKQICGDFLVKQEIHTLIGTAGVFETLSESTNDAFDEREQPISLNVNQMKEVLSKWAKSSSKEREAWTTVIPVRLKTLHLAAVLIFWILEEISCEHIVATPNSMAEGAAIAFFD